MRLFTNTPARLWVQWVEDESGQDLIEYALVFALLALAAVATLRGVGTRVVSSFTYLSTTLNGSI